MHAARLNISVQHEARLLVGNTPCPRINFLPNPSVDECEKHNKRLDVRSLTLQTAILSV